jgi:hypothetical protein
MTALMIRVIQSSPTATLAGGCSLWISSGTIQDTAGRVPARAAVKKRRTCWMFPSWWSRRTVSNFGSGFQMPGVFADSRGRWQRTAPEAQSGWRPSWT